MHYKKLYSIENAPVHPMNSVSWKELCQIRQFMLSHMHYTNNKWQWGPCSSGLFTLKSAWNEVRQSSPAFELASVVWYPHHCPKMSTCLLRTLLDKLLTRDRLKQYGIVEQDFCVLCNSETETTHHLFFNCPYSCIWSSLSSSYPLIITAYRQKQRKSKEVLAPKQKLIYCQD